MRILSDKEECWNYDKIQIADENALWNDLHGHEFVEIVYFCEEEGYHRIQDEYYPIKKGTLFLIPPRVIHCYVSNLVNPEKKPIRVINLIFLKEILGEDFTADNFIDNLYNAFGVQQRDRESTKDKEFIYCVDNNFILYDLLTEMREEQHKKRLGYHIIMESKLKEVITLMLRRCIEGDQKNLSVTSRGLVMHVASIVRENYQNPPSLSDLANQFNFSVSSIRRLFKETMGISIGKYLQIVRIQWACKFLLEGVSVEEIMGKIGLQDRKYFYELFKRETGMTPKEYKLSGANLENN